MKQLRCRSCDKTETISSIREIPDGWIDVQVYGVQIGSTTREFPALCSSCKVGQREITEIYKHRRIQ